jgi:hypothetical protein
MLSTVDRIGCRDLVYAGRKREAVWKWDGRG